jgi:hypothetical protein
MHIVYLIKFKKNELPNKYVGSKANCSIDENKIIDHSGKLYMGSTKDIEFRSLVNSGFEYELQILGKFETYQLALQAEHDIHVQLDVVASPEYFNKAIANTSTFTNPDYASYKHVTTGKRARLPRNHPKVLSGEWVGITRGTVLTEEERKKRGRPGKLNPFYGKKHPKETQERINRAVGDAQRGKPKSIEQRRKMAEAARLRWAKSREHQGGGEEKGI